MTSHELTSGFDFWSCGHLRMAVMDLPIKFCADIFIHSGVMAVMDLPIKFCADIFIHSGVIDIFPKSKMAATAILDFQVM